MPEEHSPEALAHIQGRLDDIEAQLQAKTEIPYRPPGVVLYEDDVQVSTDVSPRFRILNFIGATVDRSTDTVERADIEVTGSIGGRAGCGPFWYDYLVDANWAAVVAAGNGTEGETWTTFHGHTFEVYSTVQAAVDAWEAAGGDETILVVPGDYGTEDVVIEAPSGGVKQIILTTLGGQLTTLNSLTMAGVFGFQGEGVPESVVENFTLDLNLQLGSTAANIGRLIRGVHFRNMQVGGSIVFESDFSPKINQFDYCTFDHCDIGGGVDDNSVVLSMSRLRFNRCVFHGKWDTAHTSGASTTRMTKTYFSDCHFVDGILVGRMGNTGNVQFDNCRIDGDSTSDAAFEISNAGGSAASGHDNLIFSGCDFDYSDHSSEWAFILIGIAGDLGPNYINLAISGCTFNIPALPADSEAPIHIVWAPDDPTSGSGTYVHVALVGNAFIEDENGDRMEDLPTTSVSYSVKGYFERSVFGPNVPADFEVEILGGTNNLYVGTGLIVGTGITPVTGFFEDSYNGTILQPITFVVTSNGTTITGTLDANPSGDMTQRFSDGYTTLSSGATVTLTAGSDIAPNKRFVYILQSDKTTLVEAAAWPSAEHIQVAEVVIQSAATVQSDGVLANRNWNNMTKGTDGQGHHTHAWERLRWEHSAYRSGSAVTWTGSGGATLDLAITAGKVYQLHLQDVSAFDTTDPDSVLVPNHATAYTATADIETLILDSAGGSLSGRYYNLVIWCSVSSGSETERVFINLPGGSYNKEADATADVSGFDNYTIPTDFRGYAYLIERVTIKHSPAAGGTWTIGTRVDLRGQVPNVVAGGGTAAITTEFADNQFKLFDDGDPTKQLAFQVSRVAASTTRTITVPNEDFTLSAEYPMGITVENPSSSEDLTIKRIDAAITVKEIHAVLRGSATPSVTWTIRHQPAGTGDGRGAAGNEVVTGGTTTTSITAGDDVTAFDDATIPADSFVWLETTAKSGTVNEIHVTIRSEFD